MNQQTTIISRGEMLDQINTADYNIAEQKQNVKTVEEMVQDELESMPEWKAFDEAAKAFETAKEKLRVATLGNGDLNNHKEELAREKRELKFRQDVRSSLLVRYAIDYRLQSAEIDHQNREIVLSARIGKKLKQQVELPL